MASKKEKKRYTKTELKQFQKLITEKLEEAQTQLEFYQVSLVENAEVNKAKGTDDGSGSAENERLKNLSSRQRKHILHLENALLRIQNGVYGICRETGKLISADRLRAVPHATLSIKAKQSK